MVSSILRRIDRLAKNAEQRAKRSQKASRARTKAANMERRVQRQRRRRNLDVMESGTLGLDYQLVDDLISPEDLPEDLTEEMKRKVLKKAARAAGNHVKKAIVAQIKAEGLDSRKTGTRELWSQSQQDYHEGLGRKHLVQGIKVKVIDDKKEKRIVVLVGPDTKMNAWYAWFLEFGWFLEFWGTGAAEAQPPTFFMTKGIKKGEPGAAKVVVDKVKEFMGS